MSGSCYDTADKKSEIFFSFLGGGGFVEIFVSILLVFQENNPTLQT